MIRVFIALFVLLLAGCEDSKKFYYQALNNVGANVVISSVEAASQGSTLVQFRFEFNNESRKPINFDFNKVSMLINGKSPLEIRYNSPVSHHWPTYVLEEGYSEHYLNVYLGMEKLDEDDVIEFVVVNFGLKENE